MDILEEIVAYKRQEIAERQMYVPMHQLWELVRPRLDDETSSMSRRLRQSPTGLIAEFKRKSPSLGWIHQDAKAADITLGYQRGGATAVSILTDTHYFGGYDEFVQQARAARLGLPVLYKNFVIDEYQLFQAKYCGASAVLLIAACLSKEECTCFVGLARQLKLEVLLELHDERELDYVDAEPDMVGVNNRHLGTFVTDVNQSFLLADRLPADLCRVSESGLHDAQTVKALREAGFSGFLMGEHFMKAADPALALSQFITDLT